MTMPAANREVVGSAMEWNGLNLDKEEPPSNSTSGLSKKKMNFANASLDFYGKGTMAHRQTTRTRFLCKLKVPYVGR